MQDITSIIDTINRFGMSHWGLLVTLGIIVLTLYILDYLLAGCRKNIARARRFIDRRRSMDMSHISQMKRGTPFATSDVSLDNTKLGPAQTHGLFGPDDASTFKDGKSNPPKTEQFASASAGRTDMKKG
jgi:hypothetical protein